MTRLAWEPAEDALLRNLHEHHSAQYIADELGRSLLSVKHRITKLGLRKMPRTEYRPWTAKESAFVRKNYGPMTATQIGEHIGRTAQAVRNYAARM